MNDLRTSLMRPWRWRFVIFAFGLAVLFGIAEALFWRETPEAMRAEMLAFGAVFLALSYGLLYWLYHRLTEDLLRPLLALGRDIEAQMFSGAAIDEANYKGSLIAPFARELVREEAEDEAEGVSENWLSELLHVLDQGLIVATLEHEILLINARAREMLGRNFALALGRDLSQLLDVETVDHAILRQLGDDATGSERLFCRFTYDDQIMPARMSLLRTKSRQVLGYVLAFHDFTNALFRTQALELRFDALLRDARDFSGEMALLTGRGLPTDMVQARFAKALMQHKSEGQELLGHAWPKGRMTLHNLFRVLGDRVDVAKLAEPPRRIFLRCDGAAIIEMLEYLLTALHADGYALSVDFEIQNDAVKIIIASGERRIAIRDVEDAMRRALTRLPTAPTGHEVLRAHGTEIWPHMEDERTHLVFILKRISVAQTLEDARPEYYDFEARKTVTEMGEMRLRDLAIVVFDTETTGLDPKGGDAVVQLSAVRVKAGKVIRDENFDRLVHPGRKIPAASTKIHHITDEMVKDAPQFDVVAKAFHEFCHGEVLMAHNAAFDMAFLRKGAEAAGVQFEQPVLDTVYMSAFLFDHSGKHTLDDLAKRFGIEISEAARHTAIGDAQATAEVFVRMLPMLEARGVETLGQMIEIGNQMREIRRRQATYG